MTAGAHRHHGAVERRGLQDMRCHHEAIA
jgi:hypothetical protein